MRAWGYPSRAATARRIAISTRQMIFSPVPSESWEEVGDHCLQGLNTLGVLHGGEYGRIFAEILGSGYRIAQWIMMFGQGNREFLDVCRKGTG